MDWKTWIKDNPKKALLIAVVVVACLVAISQGG